MGTTEVLEQLVDLRELARRTELDQATLRQRIARGVLPARKVGTSWVVTEAIAAQEVARAQEYRARRMGLAPAALA